MSRYRLRIPNRHVEQLAAEPSLDGFQWRRAGRVHFAEGDRAAVVALVEFARREKLRPIPREAEAALRVGPMERR